MVADQEDSTPPQGVAETQGNSPASDQLKGVYDQAALQQRFEVVLVRMK
jgi:hypothetical protein